MNTPDLSTVAAGQMRDEMKRQIEIRIHQAPNLTVRLRVAEAAEWLRAGAPGRALEVLEALLAEFEAENHAPGNLYEAAPELLAGCKWFMAALGDGRLVRDVSRDAQPDWALQMLDFTRELTKIQKAIYTAEPPLLGSPLSKNERG
jgi:hypothetical protein